MDLKKKNQREVSEGADVYQSRVSAWLNGITETPRRDTLQKLASFFGCNIGWLETGDGPIFPTQEIPHGQVITGSAISIGGGGVAQTTKKGKNVHQSVILRDDQENFRLSTEEAMVIKLLRRKDADGNLTLKIIEQLLQMR